MYKLLDYFIEVISAILPVVVIIFILGLIFAPFEKDMLVTFFAGSFMMIFGMGLFLFGANFSMMEVGSRIGGFLVQKRSIVFLSVVAFIIGVVITIAEPDVQVLASQVAQVSAGSINKLILMTSVGVGIGVFVTLGLLRIVFQWKLLPILMASYVVVFVVAIFTSKYFVPVALDAGGVTTGPITVPFILALASGIANVIRSKKSGNDSFGLVGLSSVGPVLAVLILGMIFK